MLSFGAIAFIVILLGYFSLCQVGRMSEQSEVIGEKWLPNIVLLSNMVKVQLKSHIVMSQLVTLTDPAQQKIH